MSTGTYARYITDHRMEVLAKYAGWDLPTLGRLGFMTWIRRMEIDFHRPVSTDQEITITSLVREFLGPDAMIECTMTDAAGGTVATCLMIVAHVETVEPIGEQQPDSDYKNAYSVAVNTWEWRGASTFVFAPWNFGIGHV